MSLRRVGSSTTSLRRLATDGNSSGPNSAFSPQPHQFATPLTATPTSEGRRRSFSEPRNPPPREPTLQENVLARARTRPDDERDRGERPNTMPPVMEDSNGAEPFPRLGSGYSGERPNTMPPLSEDPSANVAGRDHAYPDVQPTPRRRRLTRNSRSVLNLGFGRGSRGNRESNASETQHPEMDADLINLLDVIGTNITCRLDLDIANACSHRP